jgi:hypothetical protein
MRRCGAGFYELETEQGLERVPATRETEGGHRNRPGAHGVQPPKDDKGEQKGWIDDQIEG